MQIHRALRALPLALLACASSPRELPAARLQATADELVARSGAPGAILAVRHGDQRWLGAAGTEDLAGQRAMRADATFRAASITKMFTGAVVLQDVAAGLALDTRLAASHPAFPNAAAITLDQLLSHTAGVTPAWFDAPPVQPAVLGELARVWSPDAVIATIAALPPYGAPGESGMQYSNTDFVLLGDVVARRDGAPIGTLLQHRIFEPLGLGHTRYGFDNPPHLVAGYSELGGTVLDLAQVPPQSILSFAGAAGAATTTADDLLTFVPALLRTDRVVDAAGRATLMTPAEPGSYYGHAVMRFCPCERDGAFTGWGHGGNLPGTWVVVVDYPERDVTVVAMINRDVIGGAALTRAVFDPTLAAVLDAVAAEE